MTHKMSQYAFFIANMWVLLEHNDITYEHGYECDVEIFPRLDFRGVYASREEAFNSIMVVSTEESRIFSVFDSEIGNYFAVDPGIDAQYQTNGEYVVELTTGKIVHGDEGVLNTIENIEKLARQKSNWTCYDIYKKVTNKYWYDCEVTAFTKPNIYRLTNTQLEQVLNLLQEAVNKNDK